MNIAGGGYVNKRHWIHFNISLFIYQGSFFHLSVGVAVSKQVSQESQADQCWTHLDESSGYHNLEAAQIQ